MKSEKEIERIIKEFYITANSEMDKKICDDVSEVMKRRKQTKLASTQPNIWRTIMRSPITKIAAVTVIIIACSAVWMLWESTGSGIALADVLTRIEQVTSYRYQVSSTTIRPQAAGTRVSAVLVSREYGLKRIVTEVDPNEIKATRGKYEVGDEWYLLLKSNSIFGISHKNKSCGGFIYDGAKIDFYKEQYNDPRIIVEQILNCEHKSIGRSTIDEITVEGFQTTDPNYGGGFFGKSDRGGKLKQADVKLWVDIDTFLPVRLEEDVVTEGGSRVHEVNSDFHWNVPITADDFEPNVPKGYERPVGDIIIRGGEENAIEGLRLFAEAAGKYPDSFELEAFYEEYEKHSATDPNSYKDLSEQEATAKANELLRIGAPLGFYGTLVDDKKEPAYYGQSVTPEDANAVLLRWKVSDSEYRVIFGDLSARTVTAEELAEIEKGRD